MVKISELLEHRKYFELKFSEQEEQKVEELKDIEFMDFQDDIIQTPIRELKGRVLEEPLRDSLMYSCDAKEDQEESAIKGKIHIQ